MWRLSAYKKSAPWHKPGPIITKLPLTEISIVWTYNNNIKNETWRFFYRHGCSPRLFNTISGAFKVSLVHGPSLAFQFCRVVLLGLFDSPFQIAYFLKFKETNSLINCLPRPLPLYWPSPAVPWPRSLPLTLWIPAWCCWYLAHAETIWLRHCKLTNQK